MDAVERLRRLAARLGELGADGQWFGDVLNRYLDPYTSCSLDEAAGLLPAPGAKGWRTVAKRAERDDAIRALAGFFSGLKRTRSADKIWKALIGYATTRWRVDRERPTMPEHYVGTPRALLYEVLVAGDGKVLGESRIRRILAISSPMVVASEIGQTGPHGTDERTIDDRRQ